MKTIRNMRELKLMKKQLQYKEQLYEKEMIGSSASVFENLGDSIRDFAFEFGMKLATRLVTGY
ncbi:MAG: hypothetical protein ACOC13_02350, partial [Tangfeifania sp.]